MEPHAPAPANPSPVERYNRRLGLALFALYLAFYATFVGIIFVDYRIMSREVIAGLNLAIVYGFGLIIAAFVLAVIYMVACRKEAEGGMPSAKFQMPNEKRATR